MDNVFIPDSSEDEEVQASKSKKKKDVKSPNKEKPEGKTGQ
jgi:hypothetical protein